MILRKERKGCSVKYTCERMDKLRNLQRKYQRDVSVLLYERDAKLQETQCNPPFLNQPPKVSYKSNPTEYFKEIYDSPPPADFNPTIIYGEHPKTHIYGFPKDTYIDTRFTTKKLFHLHQKEYYLEVVRFAPDQGGFCDLFVPLPVGTYYYPVIGSGVYHPIGKRLLMANNKAHALSILGFDFQTLIKSYFGKMPIMPLEESPTTDQIFDPQYTYEVSSYIRWANQSKSFPDILADFKKSTNSHDPLKNWLEVISNLEHTDYQYIYNGGSAHFLLDPLLYRLARRNYTSVLLLKEPTAFDNKFSMEYIDLVPTYRQSIAKLKKLSLFDPQLPPETDIDGINLVQSILDKEEVPGDKQLITNVILHKLTESLPDGYLVGSYAYGFQTIHTDIDFIYPTNNTLESVRSKIPQDFKYIRETQDTLVYEYNGIEVEVVILQPASPKNKLFKFELDLYSKFQDYPELCKAIRLLNQWGYNRQFQGSDLGYIHSTFLYALCYDAMESHAIDLDKNYIDVFTDLISLYSEKPIAFFNNIAKKYQIKFTTEIGINLLKHEFSRAAKYLSNFTRLFKSVTEKSLLKKLPHQLVIDVDKQHQSILRYFNPKGVKFRFFNTDNILKIFSDKSIPDTYISSLIRVSKKYHPDLRLTIT